MTTSFKVTREHRILYLDNITYPMSISITEGYGTKRIHLTQDDLDALRNYLDGLEEEEEIVERVEEIKPVMWDDVSFDEDIPRTISEMLEEDRELLVILG